MKLTQLKKITDRLRSYEKYEPPQPINKDLPPTYNIVLSASNKGSGKTYNIVQLLTNYEESGFVSSDGKKVRMRTIWISGGTANSKQNNILNTLKTLSNDDRIDLEDNVDDYLKILYEDVKNERDEIEAYNVYRNIYNKFIKYKNVNKLSFEELSLLKFKNFISPENDPECPRDEDGNILYHPKMVFIVLDDMIGSDGYNNKRGNFLNKLAIKSRHESNELVGLNLIFISQSFKSIPAIIRRQTDVFVLLKNSNKEYIVDAISEEVGSHFNKQELLEHYNAVSKIPYGALILSIHKKERDENRVRLGWTNRIERDPKYIL
jgi:hypothetical protein